MLPHCYDNTAEPNDGRSRLRGGQPTDDDKLPIKRIEALNEPLGPVAALRFLAMDRRDPTDYVEISRKLYQGQTIDEIFERARARARGAGR